MKKSLIAILAIANAVLLVLIARGPTWQPALAGEEVSAGSAVETVAEAETPAAETGAVTEIPTAETGAVAEMPASETGAVTEMPTAETGAVAGSAAATAVQESETKEETSDAPEGGEDEKSDAQSGASDSSGMTDEEAERIAAYYSTDEKPNIATFEWFTEDFIEILELVAEGGDYEERMAAFYGDNYSGISNIKALEGGWQMIAVWDPNDEVNSYCWDLETAELILYGEKARFVVHPYMLYEPKEGYTSDFSENADEIYAGSWDEEESSFTLTSDNGEVEVGPFWEKGGRQYAFGYIESRDGIDGLIALQRP